ncbi:hypothetical protein [Halocatena salina]|uniref:Uncharacterized protein n=1 Tax=Halocatena salina TaxID=2934340 RepID=A0A8T9ZZ32_9EURY|nr:hypothetical protein [Halocatena salina]UPM41995.1 hypothetical protein MW046_08435 [Halocatena salina]
MPDGPDEISMNEFDEQAEELLELESDLSSMAGAEMDPNEQYESGTVLGAERVLFDAVPDTYPTTILSPYALRLDVRLSPNRNTSVYIAWPEQLTGDTSLDQLLSTVGVSAHSFADILGREIPVERDGSHYVVDFEHESPDTPTTETDVSSEAPDVESLDDSSPTSPYWYYVVVACSLTWTLYFPLYEYDTMVNVTILAWLIFPVGMYFDNQHVRERSTWTPNKWVWPVLSLVWFLNIPAVLVYLYKRHQAEFPSE